MAILSVRVNTSSTPKLGAAIIMEEQKKAIEEAERDRKGFTAFTDGSRLNSGAVGYVVAWRNEGHWASIKTHMGNQEAYDVECAAIERALELTGQRRTAPEAVTIFSEAKATIERTASDDPGPGQQYAIQA